MSDPVPFLSAIASDPDDDLPRLVFADWLDENGDPDRAEFIRLQCHTARVGPLDPTWAPAKLREYDLFRANEATWRPGRRNEVSHKLMARWRRGFPACVDLTDVADGRLTSGEWCNGAFHISATMDEHEYRLEHHSWPGVGSVRGLKLSGWRTGCGSLLGSEHLRGVRAITLMEEWYAGVRATDLEAFLTELAALGAEHFPELTALELGQGELNLHAMEALATAPPLDRVTRLAVRFPDDTTTEFSQNGWAEAAAELFRRSAPRLESLEISGLPPNLLPAFAAVPWLRLRALHVNNWSNHPFDGYTQAVLPALKTVEISHLGTLALRRAWHTAGSIRALARWPALRTVNALSLGQVPAGFMQQFLANVSGASFEFLAAHVEPDTATPLRIRDIARHPCFGGLKALAGAFTPFDLTLLSSPSVLPELHTVWSGGPRPSVPLPWRGGVRTVIPRDTVSSKRPTRDEWFGLFSDWFD